MINLGSPLTGDEAEETLASDKIKRLELKLKLSDENFDLVNKELLTALKKNVRLESQLKRENKSHNYHCKESQRKNDVIDELKERLESQLERERECVDFTEAAAVLANTHLMSTSLVEIIEKVRETQKARSE